MSHARTIAYLGVFVAVFPLLGFPPAWETTVVLALGLVIAALAFLDVLAERLERQRAEDRKKAVKPRPAKSTLSNSHATQSERPKREGNSAVSPQTGVGTENTAPAAHTDADEPNQDDTRE